MLKTAMLFKIILIIWILFLMYRLFKRTVFVWNIFIVTLKKNSPKIKAYKLLNGLGSVSFYFGEFFIYFWLSYLLCLISGHIEYIGHTVVKVFHCLFRAKHFIFFPTDLDAATEMSPRPRELKLRW